MERVYLVIVESHDDRTRSVRSVHASLDGANHKAREIVAYITEHWGAGPFLPNGRPDARFVHLSDSVIDVSVVERSVEP